MASGYRHTRDSFALAPFAFLTIGAIARSGFDLELDQAVWHAGLAAVGTAAGAFFTPDLDGAPGALWTPTPHASRIYIQRLPLVGILWWAFWEVYSMLPHRSFLSHAPGVGTLGRQAYFWGIVLSVWQDLFFVGLLPAGPGVAIAYAQANATFCLSFLAGLFFADTAHAVRDWPVAAVVIALASIFLAITAIGVTMAV